jgi:hypothetical protein
MQELMNMTLSCANDCSQILSELEMEAVAQRSICMVVRQAVDTSQQYIVLHQTKKSRLFIHVLQNVRARGAAIDVISGRTCGAPRNSHVSVLSLFFTLLTKNCYLWMQMDGVSSGFTVKVLYSCLIHKKRCFVIQYFIFYEYLVIKIP